MKRSAYILIILIIVILSAVVLFTRCNAPDAADSAMNDEAALNQAEDKRPVVMEAKTSAATVYYATTDHKQLLPLTLEINDTTEVARVAVEKLLAGPPNELAVDSISTDTKLLDIYSIYHTVYVNLTREIFDIPAEEAQLAVDALCATVLPLTDGYKLQLLVEGEGYDYLHDVFIGEPLALPMINPVGQEMRQQLIESGAAYTDVVYYRVDPKSNYLIPETMPVELPEESEDPLTLAQAVLPLLLPDGYDLLSLEIIEGVACLNLSRSSYNLWWNQELEAAKVGAVVRALTALPGVEAVQFLEDGRALDTMPQGTEVKSPLRASEPINAVL